MTFTVSHTFKERLDFCERCYEGSEVGEIIQALCSASNNLWGLGDETNAQITLVIAEQLCKEYLESLLEGYPDYDSWDDLPADVIKRFSGRDKNTFDIRKHWEDIKAEEANETGV